MHRVAIQAIESNVVLRAKMMEDTILSLEKTAMERWRNGDPGGFVELSAE